GCEPAISIEIEFPLDRAGCTMESSQIGGGLFQDSSRQLFPRYPANVFVGSVHFLDLFVHSFLQPLEKAISEKERSFANSACGGGYLSETFISRYLLAPPKSTRTSFAIARTATIARASACVGLPWPGMIDEPGSSDGIMRSPKPAREPHD